MVGVASPNEALAARFPLPPENGDILVAELLAAPVGVIDHSKEIERPDSASAPFVTRLRLQSGLIASGEVFERHLRPLSYVDGERPELSGLKSALSEGAKIAPLEFFEIAGISHEVSGNEAAANDSNVPSDIQQFEGYLLKFISIGEEHVLQEQFWSVLSEELGPHNPGLLLHNVSLLGRHQELFGRFVGGGGGALISADQIFDLNGGNDRESARKDGQNSREGRDRVFNQLFQEKVCFLLGCFVLGGCLGGLAYWLAWRGERR